MPIFYKQLSSPGIFIFYSALGTIFETGEPFIVKGDTDECVRGISLIKSVLPVFNIPTGDIAVFFVGPKFLDVDTLNENVRGHAIKNMALVSWRYVHFLNEIRIE